MKSLPYLFGFLMLGLIGYFAYSINATHRLYNSNSYVVGDCLMSNVNLANDTESWEKKDKHFVMLVVNVGKKNYRTISNREDTPLFMAGTDSFGWINTMYSKIECPTPFAAVSDALKKAKGKVNIDIEDGSLKVTYQ